MPFPRYSARAEQLHISVCHATKIHINSEGLVSLSSLQVREDEVHNVPVDAAEKALQLHGHREANWVNALTVISKKEWMKRKEKYKKEASSHVPPKVQSSPPFLVARRLKEGIEPKELWRLFSAMGPIRLLDVFKGSEPTEWVNATSCVVQFESFIVGVDSFLHCSVRSGACISSSRIRNK